MNLKQPITLFFLLIDYLDNEGIDQLIITGIQTEYCIDTTCKVAFEYGFKMIIPEKTNTTFNNGNILAKDLYEHYIIKFGF
ncbi:isochorismatase family protein [Clostridium sp. FP2]|uniref:isochorismatase family protein n=1 Tax=Clostridium sp. FP2 TaxID=2724481 RepID=UPI001CCEC809|nr:isochorismatase family protein [Clostridium sp. FP2]MBZ9626287.1 isochorismatase family protein [Clostridium sp. FP2]